MPSLKRQANFSPNFESLFSFMKDPSQKGKSRFNREKARFKQDEYNFNGINRHLSEILS